MRKYQILFILIISLVLLSQLGFAGRYYDSRVGRFLQIDPKAEIGPNISPYVYSFNNPIKNIDPDGKWPESIHNKLIATAFKGDNNAIKSYQEASAWADDRSLGHQETKMSYMHGMREYPFSEDEGNQAINSYLNDPFPSAEAEGQNEFGVKLHAIMDMTSPSHEGSQEWGRPVNVSTQAGVVQAPNLGAMGVHWIKEQRILIRRAFATVRLMRQYKQDYSAKKKVDIKQYQKLFQQYMEEETDEERDWYAQQQQERIQREADRR